MNTGFGEGDSLWRVSSLTPPSCRPAPLLILGATLTSANPARPLTPSQNNYGGAGQEGTKHDYTTTVETEDIRFSNCHTNYLGLVLLSWRRKSLPALVTKLMYCRDRFTSLAKRRLINYIWISLPAHVVIIICLCILGISIFH